MTGYRGWVFGLILTGYGCGASSKVDCGTSEEWRDGQCVPVGTCGPGTLPIEGVCTIEAGGSAGSVANGGSRAVGGDAGREDSAGAPEEVAGSMGDAGSGGDIGGTGAVGGGGAPAGGAGGNAAGGDTIGGGGNLAGAAAAGSGGLGNGGKGGTGGTGGGGAGGTTGGAGGGGTGGAPEGGCTLTPETDSLTAVTFQIDSAHSGGQPLSALHAPLKRCWHKTLDTKALSYPLIANGRVFVTGTTTSGARLYALSAIDGQTLWGPIDLGSNSFGSSANAALDGDKVFTVNGSGLVSAFSAATGAPIWSRSLSSDIFSGPPVVAGGLVYVVISGTLHVLDEGTGAPLWTASPGGSPTSVALAPSLLVLEYIDGTVNGFNPSSGAPLWHTQGCCTGGGGDIPVIYQGHVFAPDFWGTNSIFDSSGNSLGSFSASAVPAFENGRGFFLSASTLEAHDLSGMVKWSFAGDQQLVSTPLAAGGAVYQGSSSGKLYALDEPTGQVTWQEDVGSPLPAANQTNGLAPTTGLAASSQLLVVPTATTVFGYGN